MTRNATPNMDLSPAERRACSLLAEGLTVREIAERTGKSIRTIQHQLRAARYKGVGVATRPRDAPLSPQLRTYLYAFEQRIRAKTDEEKVVARRIMRRAAQDSGEPWLQLHRQGERCMVDMLVEVARRNGRLSA